MRKKITMNRRALSFVLVTALVSLFGVVVSPAAHAQDTGPAATVRFAHVYSGGGPIDIYIDGKPLVSQLDFGTATEYASLPSGDRHLQVVAAGQKPETALVDKKITVDEGKAYNVLIGGQEDKLDARSYEVNLEPLDVDQARLRFIQGEPGATNLDIALTAPGADENADNSGDNNVPVFKKITDASDYQTVTAGTYGMVANDSDDEEAKVNLPDITLAIGHVYDVVVLGQIKSNNLTLLPLITAVSGPCSTTLGVGDDPTSACVRFVHVSPDAGPVDIYVDDTAVAENVSYGAATEFAAVTDEDHRIQVVPAGQSTDNRLLDEKYGFGTGQAYQISILGLHADDNNGDDDLTLKRDDLDLTPLPPQQTRVRFIQAVPDAGGVTAKTSPGITLLDNADFTDVSDYTVINAGSFDLAVTDKDNTTLVEASGQQFKEGASYDVFVIGQKADANTLQLLVLETPTEVRTGAQGTPVTVPTESTAEATTVGEASPTAVGGGAAPTATEVGGAPVTPVLTEGPTETPTP
jgi:hypothetical protein